jgi:regulatory protein
MQVKNKTRANVYLDGQFVCSLQLETILRHNLKEGSELTQEQLETMQEGSEKEQAFAKVLNTISKTMKTRVQIETYLKQKGYSSKTTEYVIKKLEEYNYINDELYAKLYMQQECKKSGVNKIKQQLVVKGVPQKIIKETLENLQGQDDEIAFLAQKYMKNKEHTQKETAKLYAYLLRRGFTYDQIKPHLKGWDEM